MRHRGVALAASLIVLAVVALASPAGSAGRVGRQAWSASTPVTTFTPAADELYVAATGGTEEARSFVELELGGLDETAIAGSRLALHEAEGGLRADSALVAACPLRDPVPGDGQLSDAPPEADCELRTNATRDADGRWVVDLAPFAARWAEGGIAGLALVPDPSAVGATFRVALDAVRSEVLVAETTASSTTSSTVPATTTGDFTGGDGPPPSDIGMGGFAPAPPPPPGDGAGVVADEPVQTFSEAADSILPGRSTAGSAVLWMLLVLVGAAVVILATPLRRRVSAPFPGVRGDRRAVGALRLVTAVLLLLPLFAREVLVYKAGVVLIFFVGAIGLHVLVNWAGQLSLAHFVMVGLPAFLVLAISDVHGISPVYLLPLAVLIGAVVGAVVGLPTLRAKGLQVALVTLVAGIALGRFFFTKEWLVGRAGGRVAAVPAIGPLEFPTSRSLYPLLLVLVLLAGLAAWALMHSKIARAWFWIRENPEAASAFGVPVVLYRIGSYAIGGAFGGLAGGLTTMWVQRLGPDAFPQSLSFSYLLVAVLAGAGFVGGVAAAALALEGGVQFSSHIFGSDVGKTVDAVLAYAGPIGLIDMLARHETGINGMGRKIMARLRFWNPPAATSRSTPTTVSWSLIGGVVFIVAGFVAIWLARVHSGQTAQLWVQNQELISGGLGGIGMILVGVGLLIRDRMTRSQEELVGRLEAIFGSAAAEETVVAEVVALEPEPTVHERPVARRRLRSART